MNILDRFCDWLEKKLDKSSSTSGSGSTTSPIPRINITKIKEVVSDVKDNTFYEKGNNILTSNGWSLTGSSYEHKNYPFRISKCIGGYEIAHKESGYKTIKIVKVENIMKRIKEYNVYLKAKKTKITKESFLSDFE